MDKKEARLRRAAKTRAKIRELGVFRLCIHRTPQHIYAQIIAPDGAHVVASASTVDKEVRPTIAGPRGTASAAVTIGKAIAERALSKGVEQVAFDRSGFR